MKQLLLIFAVVALVGCGKEEGSMEKAPTQAQSPPPKEIVVEDFLGTYDVEVPTWGPARLVFLENGVGEYHNTATAGSEVITIKWKTVKKGFVKWECRISGQPFSAVYRHNPDGSITGGMGTFKKIKSPKEAPSKSVEIANPIVEKAIRKSLKKPEGELTKADLEKVTVLVLYNKQLTNVKGLGKLTQLERLQLQRNKLTDVKGLEKLAKLWMLDLSGNQLTDVKGLEKLTQLKQLNLARNPNLTKAQIDQLQKALPKCGFYSNPTK